MTPKPLSPTAPTNSYLDSPLFALVDAMLVLAAGALWYNWPSLAAWPLLLALLPWALRILGKRPPFKRTMLDPLFLVLVLTALVGVFVSYEPARSLAKFWLVLGGVLLFYALAAQPRANLRLLVWGVGGFSAALAGYFFLTHDWQAEPAKLTVFNQIGLAWMGVRPTLRAHILHPNVMAGITAMTAPFLAAAAALAVERKQVLAAVGAGLGLLLVLFALLMSTSRGSMLALLGAGGICLLWVFSDWFSSRLGVRRGWMLAAVSAAGLVLVVLAVSFTPGGLIGIFNRLPGPARVGSRLDLVRALILLIGDFPFTGGGLDAFPGLYSQYILSIPSYRLEHGHNFYLDAALEQGLVGMAAILGLLAFSGYRIARFLWNRTETDREARLVAWAALVGLLTMAFHGVLDDVLYGSRGSLLLWVAPAAGLAAISSPPARIRIPGRIRWAVAAGLVTAGLLLGVIFQRPLRSAWHSNLGAVQMSRIELADFPTDQWRPGSKAAQLQPASQRFERALELDPQNRTAHHRLGLIALRMREFDRAVARLQAARQLSPGHPGVTKSLAFALVWDGRLDEALPLLRRIPEARFELENYIWWWRGLGREDLSQRAGAALRTLNNP